MMKYIAKINGPHKLHRYTTRGRILTTPPEVTTTPLTPQQLSYSHLVDIGLVTHLDLVPVLVGQRHQIFDQKSF